MEKMKKFLKKWFGVFIEVRASVFALMASRDEFLTHINRADNEHGATKIGFKNQNESVDYDYN